MIKTYSHPKCSHAYWCWSALDRSLKDRSRTLRAEGPSNVEPLFGTHTGAKIYPLPKRRYPPEVEGFACLAGFGRFWAGSGRFVAGLGPVWAGFWPDSDRFWPGVKDICPEGRPNRHKSDAGNPAPCKGRIIERPCITTRQRVLWHGELTPTSY